MRHAWFGLSWVFIVAAAIYDCQFAWKYREALASWELNPFACWLASVFGLHVVFGFKAASLTFACGLACFCKFHQQPKLALRITTVVACAYILLSLHYLVELAQPIPNHPQRSKLVVAPEAKVELPRTFIRLVSSP
jgi:hypothetical protein